MRLKSFLNLSIVLIGLAAIPARADDGQASIADVAKQKSSVKAKHVITDDDMPSTSQPAAPASSPGGSSTGNTGSKDAEQKPESAAPAKSGTTADLENDLKALTHDEELLNKRLQELSDKAAKATDPFRKQMYQDSINNQQVTLEEFARKRKELEQQIAASKSKKKS